MKKEYDLKKMKVAHRGSVVNAHSTKVSKTIRIDLDIVQWLLQEAERTRIPYQTLINSLLKEAMDRSHLAQTQEISDLVNEVKHERMGKTG